MTIDISTLVLLILATVGIVLHLASLPDVIHWGITSRDETISSDARVYAVSLITRSTLRVSAKLAIAAIGIIVLLRVNGLIDEPAGPVLSWLAVFTVAMLDLESVVDLAGRRYLVLRTK